MSWVRREHRPGEAMLSVSQETSSTARVASLHRAVLLFVPNREGADVMKIQVNLPRPRNPMAMAARLRRAGSHRPDGRTERQRASRALQRQLNEMKHIP